MKKKIRLIALLLALAMLLSLGLTACGGEEEQPVETDTQPTETEPVTETIYVVRSASDVLKNYVCLKFYTYNTQNTVHYTNISVTYTCMEAVE